MSDGWVDSPGSPARKDTRRWCKGKVGVEHQLVIEPDTRQAWGALGCYWSSSYFSASGAGRGYRWSWHCRHIERCTVCSKILRSWLKTEECPDLRPEPGTDAVDCGRCGLPFSAHGEDGREGGPIGRWVSHVFWFSERDRTH